MLDVFVLPQFFTEAVHLPFASDNKVLAAGRLPQTVLNGPPIQHHVLLTYHVKDCQAELGAPVQLAEAFFLESC